MQLNLVHLAAQRSFAHFTLWRSKPTGGWEFNFVDIAGFLTTRGYFVFRTSVNKHIYIRIIDNIVREVGKKDLKDEILEYVKKEEPAYIYEFFLKKIGNAVNDEFLETLPAKDVEFKKDRKDAMQIYFQNCIVKITRDKISTFPYTELNGNIWESQIIQRIFDPEAVSGSDFRTFCWNISNAELPRYEAICSTLGYLIHNYKNPAYSPAIILNDEVISDHPEGGTGKGVLLKAVEQYLKTVSIEGKTFSFDKNFVYQRVNPDTKILSFQDVNKNFDFERLFSVLTDGIDVEKKGKDSMLIPFEDAPKVVITTNYAIRGTGNSHMRRRHELEISQYYNKDRTPFDEFKKMMFHEWNKIEWEQFDAFMVECCQFYLMKGLVKQQLINLPEKRLMAETSSEFIEFMSEEMPPSGAIISRVDFYKRFLSDNPTSKIASKTFYKFVKFYVEFHKTPFKEGKSNGVMSFYF